MLDCAGHFADSVALWTPKELKENERALRLADWNVSGDCEAGKEIIENTKSAYRGVFASAGDEDAAIPEWFIWAKNLQKNRVPANGLHVVLNVKRGEVNKENHLFMIDLNPDRPEFEVIVHEMGRHANPDKGDAVDILHDCVERNEEEEDREEREERPVGGEGGILATRRCASAAGKGRRRSRSRSGNAPGPLASRPTRTGTAGAYGSSRAAGESAEPGGLGSPDADARRARSGRRPPGAGAAE